MTLHEMALLTEWQNNRHLPAEVRLEEDYDALLNNVEFALNCPPDFVPGGLAVSLHDHKTYRNRG